MPRGSEHRLTGLLVSDAQGFALEVDGWGRWRLDVANYAAASRLLNRRVTLAGRRCGFDQLEVDTIAPVYGSRAVIDGSAAHSID